MGVLSSVDIMEAVENGLNRLYPGEPVYWDYLPKDFKRPCFTLECPRMAGTELNAALGGPVYHRLRSIDRQTKAKIHIR